MYSCRSSTRLPLTLLLRASLAKTTLNVGFLSTSWCEPTCFGQPSL